MAAKRSCLFRLASVDDLTRGQPQRNSPLLREVWNIVELLPGLCLSCCAKSEVVHMCSWLFHNTTKWLDAILVLVRELFSRGVLRCQRSQRLFRSSSLTHD